MARNPNEAPQGDTGNAGPPIRDTIWEEGALNGMTDDQLIETARAYDLAFENASREEVIKAILEAQRKTDSDQAGGGQDGNEAPQGDTGKDAKPDAGNKNPPSDKGEISVFSEMCKEKTIVAVTGRPIVFDAGGNAQADKADAEYLKNIPGYEIKE